MKLLTGFTHTETLSRWNLQAFAGLGIEIVQLLLIHFLSRDEFGTNLPVISPKAVSQIRIVSWPIGSTTEIWALIEIDPRCDLPFQQLPYVQVESLVPSLFLLDMDRCRVRCHLLAFRRFASISLQYPRSKIHRRRADKARHELALRSQLVYFIWATNLLDVPILHDDDPISQRHCLNLVMGDVKCSFFRPAFCVGV